MTQGERVKEIRKTLGLTLDSFGSKLGVTKTTISRIEKGVNNLTDQMAKGICREYNVNEDWLKTGSGSMFLDINSELDELAIKYHLSSSEKAFVKKFVTLNDDSRKAVLAFMNTVISSFGSDGFYEDVPDSGEDLEKEVSPVGSEIESDVG